MMRPDHLSLTKTDRRDGWEMAIYLVYYYYNKPLLERGFLNFGECPLLLLLFP